MAFVVRGVKDDAEPERPKGDCAAAEGVKDEVVGKDGLAGVDGMEPTETVDGVG